MTRASEKPRKKSGKRSSHRLTGRELKDVLRAAPLGWREIVAATDSDSGQARKNLRRLLRGMTVNGEINQDHQGCYHLADGQADLSASVTGVLERRAGGLYFGEVAVEPGRRLRLRAGDRVEVLLQTDGGKSQARVLRVVECSAEPLIGELKWHTRYPYVESLSPEYKGRISLIDPPDVGQHGDTVAVRILGEDRRGFTGMVERVVSENRGAAHAAETLLASHGVPCEWPDAVIRGAQRLPQSVQPARHPERRDLMAVPLVTIDGETARDFDDAVFAETRRGGWRLVVAIADVAHYVKPGGVLDTCALERGNSVYLPDRVIPMLPEALSNHLCSLRPNESRLAMVCDMRISQQGNVTGYEFYEAVIQSWRRLTYTRVQEYLDTGALDVEPEVSRSLGNLKDVFAALQTAREARGALDFETHEGALELAEGVVCAIHPVIRSDAHRLIEEAMISANVCAARFLEQNSTGALYRVHEPPKGDKAEQLRQAFASAGVRLSRGELNPASIRKALRQLGDRDDRWIFELLVLRSLTQAIYAPHNKGHFGLALPRYMHFTSPIRRYADLVVHRAIKAVLHSKSTPMSEAWLVECGQQVSMTERRAEAVGWGVDGWLKCEYIADRIGEVFAGVVMGVTEFGLFVELSGFYVQGLLHISELGSDYFQYQPIAQALVGDRSGRRFGLGDQLAVTLVEVQPSQGRLDLRLAGDKSGGASRGRRARRNRR
ncbi:MAG: ribonuclease R [Gammaproteobacteria bacterium]|nr:ribonuclease R [Gammaproteobacteria bacterium]